MKSRNLLLGVAVIALAFTSCKKVDGDMDTKNVDAYVVYVDSLENVSEADAKANWEAIDASYQTRISDAEAALANMEDKEKAQERINASKAKYEALKAKMQADMNAASDAVTNAAATTVATTKQALRNALFGQGKIGDDMNFSWVNKDNILGIYQNFVNTVDANKDTYTREDWDEIKMMYEALDSRKNTVEKEGLSSDDNRKIAGLKLKFAPMYTVNRMGAKSDEMDKAKQ